MFDMQREMFFTSFSKHNTAGWNYQLIFTQRSAPFMSKIHEVSQV
jgi:hypothetical protein